MLLTITAEQAEQVIPDANSAKAAKKLAKFKDWNNIAGSEDQWIWGEITGSAIYQSAVFLPELKFECSCPSFKRPCKHALALLLVYIENQDQFSIQADESLIPERVQKWRDKKAKALDKITCEFIGDFSFHSTWEAGAIVGFGLPFDNILTASLHEVTSQFLT